MSPDGDMEGLVKEVWILNKFYNDSKCGLNEGGPNWNEGGQNWNEGDQNRNEGGQIEMS
jgi:hypothetical protein